MINIIVTIVGIYLLVGIVFMILTCVGTEGLGVTDLSIKAYFILYGSCLLWPRVIPNIVRNLRYYKKHGKLNTESIDMLHKTFKDETEP